MNHASNGNVIEIAACYRKNAAKLLVWLHVVKGILKNKLQHITKGAANSANCSSQQLISSVSLTVSVSHWEPGDQGSVTVCTGSLTWDGMWLAG